MTKRGIGRRFGVGTAVTLGVLALAFAPLSAAADAPQITFDAPTTQTIEYGTYWQFPATATGTDVTVDGDFTATGSVSGAPSGYQAGFYVYPTDPNTLAAGAAESGQTFLPVGSYSITVTVTSAGTGALTTASPAQLTVTPAALGVAVSITADGQNPRNAVVVAQLTGALITSSGGEGGPDLAQVMPAGTWKVHITDSGGATVQDFSADRKAGGYSTATSFSWPDVAAGDYKATATFTATGGPASNFDIADSAPATFTAPGAAPGDESTAAPAPSEPAAAADTGPDVPAWLLLAVGVVTAALLALVVFQIVQLARVDRAPVAAAAAAQPATSATDGSAR